MRDALPCDPLAALAACSTQRVLRVPGQVGFSGDVQLDEFVDGSHTSVVDALLPQSALPLDRVRFDVEGSGWVAWHVDAPAFAAPVPRCFLAVGGEPQVLDGHSVTPQAGLTQCS